MLYSPAEAASALGIGRTKLFELLSSGAIESLRIGTLRRIPAASLHRYVETLLGYVHLQAEHRIVAADAMTRALWG